MTDTPDTVPLGALRYGHEAPETLNARVTDRLVGIEGLANSIAYKGLLQRLGVVRHEDGNLYVAFGNRRLAGLHTLRDEARDSRGVPVDDDFPVRVDFHEGSLAELLESSLAENIERAPLHPVDQFEAFAAMAERGMSQADMAARHGIGEREVAQLLALGSLAPELREMWRGGDIDADIAKAFTLVKDHAVQMRTYTDLSEAGAFFNAHHVRHALTGGAPVKKALSFVGEDAYVAAGGSVSRDLFGDNVVVEDVALLNMLADEKLAGEILRIKEATPLAWVEAGYTVDAWWTLERLQVAVNLKPKERKRLEECSEDPTPAAQLGRAGSKWRPRPGPTPRPTRPGAASLCSPSRTGASPTPWAWCGARTASGAVST